MYAEALDDTIGLDVTSELIVSRSGFNPDDVMIARTCPRCGRQPSEVSSHDFAREVRLEVAIDKPLPDQVDLKSSGLLSCECYHCGSIYCVFVFGPLRHGEVVLTGYFTIVENRFLDNITDELEALACEGRVPENIDDWAAGKLASALVEVLALMDDQVWTITGRWNEVKYRKKWVL